MKTKLLALALLSFTCGTYAAETCEACKEACKKIQQEWRQLQVENNALYRNLLTLPSSPVASKSTDQLEEENRQMRLTMMAQLKNKLGTKPEDSR